MNRFNEGEKAKEERRKYQKTAQVLTLFIVSYVAQWLPWIVYCIWSFVTPPPTVMVSSMYPPVAHNIVWLFPKLWGGNVFSRVCLYVGSIWPFTRMHWPHRTVPCYWCWHLVSAYWRTYGWRAFDSNFIHHLRKKMVILPCGISLWLLSNCAVTVVVIFVPEKFIFCMAAVVHSMVSILPFLRSDGWPEIK